MTTLTWRDAYDDVMTADSARRPDESDTGEFTGAHYMLEEDSGFRPGRPNVEPGFLLSFIYEDAEGDTFEETALGKWPDLDAAKTAAERYEQTGSTDDVPTGRPDPTGPSYRVGSDDGYPAVLSDQATVVVVEGGQELAARIAQALNAQASVNVVTFQGKTE
jgi:hypothetical protein